MKTLLFIPILIFGLIDGCNNPQKDIQTSKNDTISINLKQSYINSENNFSLKFDSVLEESRCPEGGMCVWAGNAKVRLIFTFENRKDTFALNTNANMPSGSTFYVSNGYKISLIELKPYPKLINMMNPPEPDIAKIAIER